MKAMTKQQLAQCAGVTVRTLFNWCRPYRMKWIADRFCIDLET